MVAGINEVSELADEVACANRNQGQGIEEINKAMTQVDGLTQRNAATSEEAASASEELSAQAGELKAMVATLVQVARGGDGPAFGTRSGLALSLGSYGRATPHGFHPVRRYLRRGPRPGNPLAVETGGEDMNILRLIEPWAILLLCLVVGTASGQTPMEISAFGDLVLPFGSSETNGDQFQVNQAELDLTAEVGPGATADMALAL